ncbi:hypothetical protein [Sinimarinibacterium sp. NLF-5-8]|uniref:hypothetical protein n=1 Tax=Sinimarinibacterium sp. NLF-5-8 TaxID=2698684 RepID=UPI00137BD101|nr:hypothetical protein [Sinimarinibacterium sp. NLF-5-8]QHS09038.1 hypothetical protein GT972_02020 [Sinimarinibacterium sp. NLF-5-8]
MKKLIALTALVLTLTGCRIETDDPGVCYADLTEYYALCLGDDGVATWWEGDSFGEYVYYANAEQVIVMDHRNREIVYQYTENGDLVGGGVRLRRI